MAKPTCKLTCTVAALLLSRAGCSAGGSGRSLSPAGLFAPLAPPPRPPPDASTLESSVSSRDNKLPPPPPPPSPPLACTDAPYTLRQALICEANVRGGGRSPGSRVDERPLEKMTALEVALGERTSLGTRH